MLQLLEEPAVNHRQQVNLLDAIAYLQCFRHNKDAHVGRLMQRLLDVTNLYFVVLDESMHALSYHPQTFLQRFLESPSDGHHLTDAFH